LTPDALGAGLGRSGLDAERLEPSVAGLDAERPSAST
jgi:hypothetical protein